MPNNWWIIYALIAAVSAALVSVFGKVGMTGIDSNLATTLRGIVQVLCLLIFATAMGLWSKLPTVHGKAIWMILLSGAAGATSWLFGFKALQIAKVSQVAPLDKLSVPIAAVLAVIFLNEHPTGTNWLGIGLIAVGAYLSSVKF